CRPRLGSSRRSRSPRRRDRRDDHARLAAGLLRLRWLRGACPAARFRLPPSGRALSRAAWIVVALLASGAALVGVELGKGALSQPAPKIADPCQPREGRTGGIDATLQRIVLDRLDSAACRLHTTRGVRDHSIVRAGPPLHPRLH